MTMAYTLNRPGFDGDFRCWVQPPARSGSERSSRLRTPRANAVDGGVQPPGVDCPRTWGVIGPTPARVFMPLAIPGFAYTSFMVRRRSTVRFRNGAPAQSNNSNIRKSPGGHSGGQLDPVPAKPKNRAGNPSLPVREAMRSGRLSLGPARLRRGSWAWRAGWTGSPGVRGLSAAGSRRAVVWPTRVHRPGWWSCRSKSARWTASAARARTPGSGRRRVRVLRLR